MEPAHACPCITPHARCVHPARIKDNTRSGSTALVCSPTRRFPALFRDRLSWPLAVKARIGCARIPGMRRICASFLAVHPGASSPPSKSTKQPGFFRKSSMPSPYRFPRTTTVRPLTLGTVRDGVDVAYVVVYDQHGRALNAASRPCAGVQTAVFLSRQLRFDAMQGTSPFSSSKPFPASVRPLQDD